MGRPFTLKSAFEYLKQAGYTTSRDTVRDYVAWAEDAWLLFQVPIHAHSQKEQERKFEENGVTVHVLPAWRWLLA